LRTANGWATVRHAGGLHARPCALLANAVKKYEAAVEIRAHGKSANARSATAIMGLAIGEGEEVEISASGANAGDALEAAIIALETPSEMEHAAPAVETVVVTAGSLLPGQLAGVVASPGMAMGFTVRLEHAVGAISEQGEGETLERRALAAALHAVVGDIEATIAEAERRGFAEQAEIFAAHRVLADDPEMFAYASGLIAAGKSAAFAWRASVEAQCATLSATGNPLLVGRVADLRDIERQVLRKLAGDTASEPDLPPNAVVLADDLVPSDFAVLVRAKAAAIVTAKGGATSHIAILARAQGIPTLVAVGLPLAEVRDGVNVIVDAERGVLDLAPTAERIAARPRRVIERQSERTRRGPGAGAR
jgi:phosphotransferase system HPr (HPr) family protein